MAAKDITCADRIEAVFETFEEAVRLERGFPDDARPARILDTLERLEQTAAHQSDLLGIVATQSDYEKIDALIAAMRAYNRQTADELRRLYASVALYMTQQEGVPA